MPIPRTTVLLARLACAPALAGTALTAEDFGTITDADLRRWNGSGCSFAVFHGKQNIGLFDIEDEKRTAVFKVDGKLLIVAASAKDKAAYWTGAVAGYTLRLFKGKVDPNVRLDEGQGGFGRMEWTGAGGRGAIPIRWQEGC